MNPRPQPSPSAAVQGKEAVKNGAKKWVLTDRITIGFVVESFPEGLPELGVAAVRLFGWCGYWIASPVESKKLSSDSGRSECI